MHYFPSFSCCRFRGETLQQKIEATIGLVCVNSAGSTVLLDASESEWWTLNVAEVDLCLAAVRLLLWEPPRKKTRDEAGQTADRQHRTIHKGNRLLRNYEAATPAAAVTTEAFFLKEAVTFRSDRQSNSQTKTFWNIPMFADTCSNKNKDLRQLKYRWISTENRVFSKKDVSWIVSNLR